jgi:hypothetical protein
MISHHLFDIISSGWLWIAGRSRQAPERPDARRGGKTRAEDAGQAAHAARSISSSNAFPHSAFAALHGGLGAIRGPRGVSALRRGAERAWRRVQRHDGDNIVFLSPLPFFLL